MAFKPNAKGKQVSKQRQQQAKAKAAAAEAEAETSSSGASSSGALRKRASERYSKPVRRASISTRSVKQQAGDEPSPHLPETRPQDLAKERIPENVVVKKQPPQQVTGAVAETSGKSRPPARRSAWEFEDTVWGYKENLDGVPNKQAAAAAQRVTKGYGPHDGSKEVVKEKRIAEIPFEGDMTEDIDKHVLRKYHVCQKLGKGVTTIA